MSYTDKCIYIDLSSGKSEIKDTEKYLKDNYIGGKGMGFALLEKHAPEAPYFSEQNPLIFLNGPFTGTKIQTAARTSVVTRSPLTGSLHDGHCGGMFGPRLKSAGYDYLFITGKSKTPVYIYINEDKISIKDAASIWGKGIFYTNDELIRVNKGFDPRVAAIGPAGENLSKMACIGVDKHRQFGRGGVGAVMGSKNLKAIVVDGNIPVKYFDEKKFNELNIQLTKDILNHDGIKFRRQKGTMKCIRSGQTNEFLPTKNFQKCLYDDFEKISSETTRERLNWEDTGCFNCAIKCSKWARWDGHEIEGPEYETAAFLGSGCEVSDIKDVALANEICNDLGFDTISVGVTCSFAMECYEKGLIDRKELDLTWGNAQAQRNLIEQMATRKGLGAIFADGTRDASIKIGQGSEEFAINTFGMEISGVNPKGSLTMGVVMAVADFASHTRLWCTEAEMGPNFKIEDIPLTVADGIDDVNSRNSMIICDFVPFGMDRLVPVLNAATGSEHSPQSMKVIGARITNLARRYNIRNGRKNTDDTLPERFFNEESLSGFMRGKKLEKEFFRSLIHQYYKIRGWNEKGEPEKETLLKYSL